MEASPMRRKESGEETVRPASRTSCKSPFWSTLSPLHPRVQSPQTPKIPRFSTSVTRLGSPYGSPASLRLGQFSASPADWQKPLPRLSPDRPAAHKRRLFYNTLPSPPVTGLTAVPPTLPTAPVPLSPGSVEGTPKRRRISERREYPHISPNKPAKRTLNMEAIRAVKKKRELEEQIAPVELTEIDGLAAQRLCSLSPSTKRSRSRTASVDTTGVDVLMQAVNKRASNNSPLRDQTDHAADEFTQNNNILVTPEKAVSLSTGVNSASKRKGSASKSAKPKGCRCKKSKCLKLYCECFARQEKCSGCSCQGCFNTSDYEEVRSKAIRTILARDPKAFFRSTNKAKLSGAAKHPKGCHCKKSQCLKKYCECFQAGIACGGKCKCRDCHNGPGVQFPSISQARSSSNVLVQSSSASPRVLSFSASDVSS